MQITSAQNARVKRVIRLRRGRERRRTGLFIAEGQREVLRALDAGLELEELFLAPQLLGEAGTAVVTAALHKAGCGATRLEVSASVFSRMAYRAEPEGVLAVTRQPVFELANLTSATSGTRYLVAVGSEKPGNLGAMVRTADAAGCDAVLAAGAAVDPFNPNAIRASTAAVFAMPVINVDEAAARNWLVERNVRIIAAALSETAVDYRRADWSGPLAVVIGPEDAGLTESWHTAAKESGGAVVRISMRGRIVDSLNASNAAAILLFHAADASNHGRSSV